MNVRSVDINGECMNTPTIISLFAGCGGSSLGYHMAGYKELLAVDFDDNAIETFKLNFKDVSILKADISQLSGTKIMELCDIQVGELDLLDGSPPCQGFSTAGKRQVCDTRNDLVTHYIRLIEETQPKVFVMENVSGMIKGTMKGLFIGYIKAMKNVGYQVSCRLLNAKWFSVPQSRQRIICVGVRNDLGMQPVFPKAHDRVITVREAIENCKVDTEIKYLTGDKAKHLKKVKAGENMSKYVKNKYFGTQRVHPDKPSPTITKTFGTGQYGDFLAHFESDRAMTITEVKRLQSFPDNFKFVGKFEQQWARIGNSVPPLMAKAIAETIRDEILIKT